VTGAQHDSGPTAAPLFRRGRELRSELLLPVFAVDLFLRILILGGPAYGCGGSPILEAPLGNPPGSGNAAAWPLRPSGGGSRSRSVTNREHSLSANRRSVRNIPFGTVRLRRAERHFLLRWLSSGECAAKFSGPAL
jgi:hypothetical protein